MRRPHHEAPVATSTTSTSSASPASLKMACPGKPSFEDTLAEYMRTRVVYEKRPVCILVDAFRHAGSFQSRRVREGLQDESPASSGAAVSEPAQHPPSRVLYFLSHFHSDHYTGLGPGWSYGTIFCTTGTAALVRTQLGVLPQYVQSLDYGVPYTIDLISGELTPEPAASTIASASRRNSCRVRLVPANHCPAAAILVFECPAPVGTVVHTGDLRYNRTYSHWQKHALGMSTATTLAAGRHALRRCLVPPGLVTQAHQSSQALLSLLTPFYEQFVGDDPVLTEIAGKVDTLFLDNTFCDPAFRFPAQWDSTQVVVETLRSLFLQTRGTNTSQADNEGSVKDVHIAVLIASYVIGKERVAFALQEAFQPVHSGAPAEHALVPIHVTPSKHDTLKAIGFHPARFHRLCSAHHTRAPPDDVNLNPNDPPEAAEGTHEVDPEAVEVTLPILLRDAVATCEESREVLLTPTSSASASHTDPLHTSRALDFEVEAEASREEHPQADAHGDGSDRRAHARYRLTLVLVPFGALSYPLLAPACGAGAARHSKRPRTDEGDAGDYSAESKSVAQPLLDIGDGLALRLSRYDHVLTVMPTGWAKRPKSRQLSERCTQLDIPYSEHCSFDELLDFVAFVNPRRVIPTVSADQFRKQESLFVQCAPRLRAQNGATQPLTRFWQAATKKEESSDADHAVREKPSNPFAPVLASLSAPPCASTLDGCATVPISLTTRKPNVPKEKTLAAVAPAKKEMHEPASQSSLSAFGVTLTRNRCAAACETEEAESDDDCVVVTKVTQAVVEISDDDDS